MSTLFSSSVQTKLASSGELEALKYLADFRFQKIIPTDQPHNVTDTKNDQKNQ